MNCQHQKTVLRFHKVAPNVLEKAVRLREQTVFVFANFQVHLEEDAKFLFGLRYSNRKALALRFPNRAVSRIVHSFPESLKIRPQVQPVPFGLLHEVEARVAQRQIVVQAAHRDGMAFGNQLIDEKAPRLLVVY